MRTLKDIKKRIKELGFEPAGEGKDGVAFVSQYFTAIFSWGKGWEHLSIVLLGNNGPPAWKDMCVFKNAFWGEDETCVQYHPAKKDYVNNHPDCLHIWKPTGRVVLPKPPTMLIGVLPEGKDNGGSMEETDTNS